MHFNHSDSPHSYILLNSTFVNHGDNIHSNDVTMATVVVRSTVSLFGCVQFI